MEAILNKTNLPENVIDVLRAFHDPMKLVINNANIKFLFEPNEDCGVVSLIDPIAKRDNFQDIYNNFVQQIFFPIIIPSTIKFKLLF